MIEDREQYKKQCRDCGADIYWKHPQYRRCYTCHKKHRKDVEQPMPIINLDSKRIGAGDRPGTHPENGKRQLSEEIRAKIAYLLATLTPITDIKKCLEKETGLKINYGVIGSIRDSEKWGVVIKQLRKEWLSKVAEVPIANKRYRLEKYQKILEKCLDDYDFKQATTVLRNAKDEMEQHDIKQGNNFYSLTYINDLSDQDLMRKRDEILKRLKNSKIDLVEAANIKENLENTEEPIDIEGEIESCPTQSEETQL